ncbi:MAG: DUF2652 domain-containing protein, partial [Flavisolibacter sp.]|nr:DUF2652 domain-containing protein [Flavisolibacter sp.]
AHFGEVAGYSVKKHNKLYGKYVIVNHRLLKNSLNKKEYVLITDPLVNGAQQALPSHPWFQPEESLEKYDVGEVRFKIADLTPLHQDLPPVEVPALRMSEKMKIEFTIEKIIQAPMMETFMAVFDLAQRPKWMEGVKAVEMVSKDSINKVGTQHRCIVSEKNNSVVITEKGSSGTDKLELVEVTENKMGGCRYIVEKVNEEQTRMKVDMLVNKNVLISTVFKLFMKGKMKKVLIKSLVNLQQFFIRQ